MVRKFFDHTRSYSNLKEISRPIEGITISSSSHFLLKYPSSLDNPRDFEVVIRLPSDIDLPDEFYLILKDVTSDVEQMRLYFKSEGKEEKIGLRRVILRRPNNESKHHVVFDGKKYLVTVILFAPIFVREEGYHKFIFELKIEGKGVEFVERFNVEQDVKANFVTSKVFDNQFYQAIVGSMLSYASVYPLKVYLFKDGKLEYTGTRLHRECKNIECLNKLRDEFDNLVLKFKPTGPNEYLVLVGANPINNAIEKTMSTIFFEELLDFPTSLVPFYVIGRQAEYVGNLERLFINMFFAPSYKTEDYIRNYLQLISRSELVNDVGYVQVKDLTLVKQGDFYLLITPIITEDYFKELISHVMNKDKEAVRSLLENFKEYQVKKIRDYQSSLLSKLLDLKFNWDKPSFYFSKAIYELTSSDCRNSLYYIPFSSLLVSNNRLFLFEFSDDCEVYYSLGDLFLSIFSDNSTFFFSGLERRIVERVKNYIKKVDELDLDLVKSLEKRPILLMRLLNDLVSTVLFNDYTKLSVKDVEEASLKAFEITYNQLKYDIHKIYSLLEKVCFGSRRSFIRTLISVIYGNKEKFNLDFILTLRDAYFIKLIERKGVRLTGSFYYLKWLDSIGITREDLKGATSSSKGLERFYYQYCTLFDKRKKDVLLPIFRQYMLNILLHHVELPPEDEIPEKFDAEKFYELAVKLDCGITILDNSIAKGSEGSYETFKNVPLPVFIYTPERNLVTTKGRSVVVSRRNFVLFSFTTPIITLEDGFELSHQGHKLMVRGEQVFIQHEGNEHPEIIVSVKYPQLEEVLELISDKEVFLKNFNEILNSNYSDVKSIIEEILESAKSQGVALACAEIQPMVNPSGTFSVSFRPGALKLGILTSSK